MATVLESQESVNTFVVSQVCLEQSIMSSDDDEPVQIRRTLIKKRINLSDDEDSDKGSKNSNKGSENSAKSSGDEVETPRTKKKKQRRVIMRSDSDDSDKEKGSQRSDKGSVKSKDSSEGESSRTQEDTPRTKKKKQRRVVMRSDSDEDKGSDKGSIKSKDSSERESSRTKEDSPRTKKKKQKKVIARKSSDNSESDEEQSVSRSSQDDASAQQRKILESLRAENNAESSEDDAPKSGRHSNNSRRDDSEGENETHWDSGKSKSKRPKAPARKSAAACRKAMQEERLKLVSESQRMVRESKAALPYHIPKQRSIKEFLQARQQSNSRLRGVKSQNVAIELIGHDLEEQEKKVEEFYKAASDEEIERYTPEIPSSTPEPKGDKLQENRILRVLLTNPEEEAKNKKQEETVKPDTSPEMKGDSENLQENQMVIASPEKLSVNKETENLTPELQSDVSDTTGDPDNSENIKENQVISPKKLTENIENEILTSELSSSTDEEKQDGVVASEKEESMKMQTKTDQKVSKDTEVRPEIISETDKNTLEVEPMETQVSKNTTEMVKSDTKDIEFEILAPDTCDSINEIEKQPGDKIPESQEDSGFNFGIFSSEPITKVAETFKVPPPQISKLILSSELTDACLTPSDAISNVFLKPAEKIQKNSNDEIIENSEDTEDFHLFLEDSDDVVKHLMEKEKELEKDKETEKESEKSSGLDLTKLYNTNVFSDDEEIPEEPKELTEKEKLFAKLKLSSGPIRLKGGPNEFIDLDEDIKSTNQEGFEKIMKTYARHVSAGSKKPACRESMMKFIESGEALDDTPDMKAKPGEKMNILKTELKHSIAKLRDQEFKKRQREYQMYENETEGLLGDDEDDYCKTLSDEELDELKTANEELNEANKEVVAEESDGGSTETEPELEDDVEMKDAPRQKSEFMDAEAEESDIDDEIAAEERGEEEEEEEEGGESGEEAGESSNEDDEQSEEEEEEAVTASSGNKCKFQRIKLVEDSDDEDNESKTKAGADIKTDENDTQVLENTPEDVDLEKESTANNSFTLTLMENEPKLLPGSTTPKSQDLFNCNSKKGKYPDGLTQLFEGEKPSPSTSKSQPNMTPNKFPRGLSKLISSESLPGDLSELCSGQFPQTQHEMSSELKKLVGNSTQTETQNLEFLCSGQFKTQLETQSEKQEMSTELQKLISNSQPDSQELAFLCSGQFETQQQEVSKELKTLLINKSNSVPDNLEDLCSGQFITQSSDELVTQDKPKGIEKLVQNYDSLPTNLADLCSGQFLTQDDDDKMNETLEEQKDEPESTSVKKSGVVEMRIVSDDEDDLDLAAAACRKRKRKLAFSDDEDEEEEKEEDGDKIDDSEPEVETQGLEDEGGYVDYDSEENEIVVEKKNFARPQEFFEEEAELSGESDWGSADEDEGGLDRLEKESGDTEKFDEQELASQLGKIHARRLLDDDKRDVRLFQEAFLEDGDLHSEGGGRQRQFRWKNTGDDTWAEGGNPKLSGDEGGDEDDEQEDSSWRTARLERETWLQQNKDKKDGSPSLDDNSQLLQMGRTLLAKMCNNRPKLNNSNNGSAPQQGEISPSKAMLQALKRKSGSFLARRSISMTRVVAMAGTEGDGVVNTSSNRNFVFSTISPTSVKFPGPKNNSEQQDDSSQNNNSKKRRMKAKADGTKQKVTNRKPRSSIFEHLK